jgi:hypothetical protein
MRACALLWSISIQHQLIYFGAQLKAKMASCNKSRCDAIRVTLYFSVLELIFAVFMVAALNWTKSTNFAIFVIINVTIVFLIVSHILQIYGSCYGGNYCLLVTTGCLRVVAIICGGCAAILWCLSTILTWPVYW